MTDPRPETQAESLRSEAHKASDAVVMWRGMLGNPKSAAAEKVYLAARDALEALIDRLADALADAEETAESAQQLHRLEHDENHRLRQENASLLKRAEEAEHKIAAGVGQHSLSPSGSERCSDSEHAELEQLFALQHTRTVEATRLWRAAHPGNDLVSPDLGKLIEWLLKRAEAAEDRLLRMQIDADSHAMGKFLHDHDAVVARAAAKKIDADIDSLDARDAIEWKKRAEEAERTRDRAYADKDTAIEQYKEWLDTAMKERDEARRLHDEHCTVQTPAGKERGLPIYSSGCTPPWRKRG